MSGLARQVLLGDELLAALASQADHLAAADAARRRADQLVRQVADTDRQPTGELEPAAPPADAVDRCRRSVAVVLPWRRPPDEDTPALLAAVAAAARRGCAVRVLLDRCGRPEPGSAELAARGAAVRLARGPVHPLVVVDDAVALLPEAPEVRQPSLVALIRTAFDQAWRWAAPVVGTGTGTGTDDVKQRILHLLAAGAKDELIARRLGISLRTCRRHVAEILLQVGAVSRFQAGVLAVRDGVVALPPTDPAD